MPKMGNILANIPDHLPHELTEVLLQADKLRIERIISTGHKSPQEFWYDQSDSEWILLLSGKARLKFEDGSSVALETGDYYHIRAHCKHRVEWTSPQEPTVWLAIFHS